MDSIKHSPEAMLTFGLINAIGRTNPELARFVIDFFAAKAIGDDTLQRDTQGRVVPDAFTHGTSAQRTKWFRQGYDSARLESCDTFKPDYDAL